MTTSALIMLIASWAVISALTGWFFWRVLRTPHRPDHNSGDGAQLDRSPPRDRT